MSFGGHRVVPFTHAYRGPGIGAAFKGVAERTPTIGDANVAAWQHHVKMMHSHSQASMKTLSRTRSSRSPTRTTSATPTSTSTATRRCAEGGGVCRAPP